MCGVLPSKKKKKKGGDQEDPVSVRRRRRRQAHRPRGASPPSPGPHEHHQDRGHPSASFPGRLQRRLHRVRAHGHGPSPRDLLQPGDDGREKAVDREEFEHSIPRSSAPRGVFLKWLLLTFLLFQGFSSGDVAGGALLSGSYFVVVFYPTRKLYHNVLRRCSNPVRPGTCTVYLEAQTE